MKSLAQRCSRNVVWKWGHRRNWKSTTIGFMTTGSLIVVLVANHSKVSENSKIIREAMTWPSVTFALNLSPKLGWVAMSSNTGRNTFIVTSVITRRSGKITWGSTWPLMRVLNFPVINAHSPQVLKSDLRNTREKITRRRSHLCVTSALGVTTGQTRRVM